MLGRPVSLYTWASWQSPRLTYPEARSQADRGLYPGAFVLRPRGPTTQRRPSWWVPVPEDLISRLGWRDALRWSGWHAPSSVPSSLMTLAEWCAYTRRRWPE